MKPELHPGRYAYCVVDDLASLSDLDPVVVVREREGLTVVVEERSAVEAGLETLLVVEWITLSVHSDLEAVGLTAAFADALAAAGLSCNVVAGAFHDHLFVPAGDGRSAVQVLRNLQR